MSIRQFERFLERSKKEFKNLLVESIDMNDKMMKMLRRMGQKCSSIVEEEILGENLNEVFSEHMKMLNQGA